MGSRELTVMWAGPATPNGVIILYSLYVDGAIAFTGVVNATIVSGLLPFAEHTLTLEACTAVGCSNSTPVISQTLPDAPADLAPPTLTVLGPSSILVRWRLPSTPNGVISRMELRQLTESAFEVVFNDVDLELETTLTGLLPNTLYTFQLLAFNAGGSVTSSSVQALTLEDIPDDISPPTVGAVGATFLEASWSPPGIPNGDIILYNLTLDGGLVFSTAEGFSYNITDLRPFTSYSLAVIACTTRGCGSSNQSTARTLEDIPSGYTQPALLTVTSSAIRVDIIPVTNENGVVTYMLYVSGNFPAAGMGALDVEQQQRVVFNDSVPSVAQSTGLIPFTHYILVLVVSNSAGTLEGPPFVVQTLSAGKQAY